jgi:hypothetical protein
MKPLLGWFLTRPTLSLKLADASSAAGQDGVRQEIVIAAVVCEALPARLVAVTRQVSLPGALGM